MSFSRSNLSDDLAAIAAAARDAMLRARHVVVLSGAGMSAQSGIATFRGGDDSLWSRFDPQQLATEQAWRRDAALVWGWYRWRIARVAAAQPHAGHHALAALATHMPLQVVTQNVDDLHERAGSEVLAHLHGRLDALRCFDCGRAHADPLPHYDPADPPQRLAPPACAQCGGQVRPGVVWFGEALPETAWQVAVQAVVAADLVLVVGTSGLVQPAAGLPALARRNGATLLEINPERSALTAGVDLYWPTTAAPALPQLLPA